MRGLRQLTAMDLLLYFREPIATFFTLAFPPLLVVLFGTIYGNDPTPMFGGRGSMDVSLPAYTALILGTVAFLGIPINISSNRETGVLRRYRAAGVPEHVYILADVITNLVMTVLGMLLLIVVGRLLYHAHIEGNPLLVLVGVLFCALSMFSIGYLIASVAPNARTAQVIGMVVFYPMMFLSGAGIPIEVMPESVRRISEFLPLTYAVRLLKGLWFGVPWSDLLLETAVLGGTMVICALLASRFFRWE
ncbi:MAG: ABC transporter permease [Thermoleophilia bacterium]|nr:ABC transporter permease [Thermoleophilia bacterium]